MTVLTYKCVCQDEFKEEFNVGHYRFTCVFWGGVLFDARDEQ
jgi:hypothetical protein